jgi:uncharacterized protein
MEQPHSSKDFDKLRQAANRFQNRAAKYHSEGDAVRPEELYLRALDMQQTVWGPVHPEVAHTLNNLALYYKQLGRLAEARPLYERALVIFRKTEGASHPDTATTMYNLAQLFKAQGKEMERRARQAYKDAREIADPAEVARAVIRTDLARYPLRVGTSSIHRFGVFSLERIPGGSKIIPYLGKLVSRRECLRGGATSRTYLLKLNAYWCIDGSTGGSGAELINHSCEPNCRFSTRGNSVWIVSLRKIDPHEELLIDYRFSHRYQAVPCYCGAATCRGMINRRRPLKP